ncbi:hypothetical protein F4604DRAFT_1676839 [Suillus subluteus]|nr:hypothetical protein F4604DRAFT_1676839 [Suillus subluteus]
MAMLKAKEVMPRRTMHLVKWVRTNTTRGVRGRWVSQKCKNPGRSVQSSPTKSHTKLPTKQPSDKTTYRFSEDFNASYDNQGGINHIQLPNGRGKTKTSPNEYLRQWKYRTHDYLDIMLQWEAPPSDQVEYSLWPFHRISERTTLTKLGIEIHAGHGGKPCPHHDWEWEDTDDEGRYAPGTPGLGEDAPSAEVPLELPETYDGEPDVFVEPGSAAAAQDLPELFKMGLFPASFTRPKTAFTFALLDDFILDNLECRTSAMNYYSKLKRITSSVFPHLVPLNIFTRHAQKNKVWLTNGQCFMVARARYQAQLAISKDSAQRPIPLGTNWRPPESGGVPAPGMGALFQIQWWIFKREKDGLSRTFTFYDVNCQYYKHLQRRVDKSLHLTIPSGMEIVLGIGLWHIHGHQDKCFVWYTSNFIPGAARIDGEIMETLWAPLNIISPSARGMSMLHRQECLDYQMNDCNFMRMIRMGSWGLWCDMT